MSWEVFFILLLSSVFHATWNIASRAYRNESGFLWNIIFWSSVFPWVTYPFVKGSLALTPKVLVLSVISGIGLAVYYKFVRLSYKNSDISIVYPIIRSSPLWVALASVLILGEQLSFFAWLGIMIVLMGILVLPQSSLHPTVILQKLSSLRSTLSYAIYASLGTTVYTLSDYEAMKQAIDPLSSMCFLCYSSLFGMVFWWLIDRKAAEGFCWRRLSIAKLGYAHALLYGLLAFAAYVITIAMMIYAPASKVLALTNLSLILGTLAGIIFFKERSFLQNRIIGLAFIIAGVTLIKLY